MVKSERVKVKLKKFYNMGNNTINAAYEFLRRGYTGNSLRKEVNRYCDFIRKREADGNPITYPDKYVKMWIIKADNNIPPTEGAQIADFLQSWGCDKLDIICKFLRFEVVGDTFVVFTQGTTRTELEGIDNYIIKNHKNAVLQLLLQMGLHGIEFKPEERGREQKPNKKNKDVQRIINEILPPLMAKEETDKIAEGVPREELDKWLSPEGRMGHTRKWLIENEYLRKAKASVKNKRDGDGWIIAEQIAYAEAAREFERQFVEFCNTHKMQ